MNALQRLLILHRDGYRCAWCGWGYAPVMWIEAFERAVVLCCSIETKRHPLGRLQVDHIDGRSKRGPLHCERLDQVLTLCARCHARKVRSKPWINAMGDRIHVYDAWERSVAGARTATLTARFGIREHELYRAALRTEAGM